MYIILVLKQLVNPYLLSNFKKLDQPKFFFKTSYKSNQIF